MTNNLVNMIYNEYYDIIISNHKIVHVYNNCSTRPTDNFTKSLLVYDYMHAHVHPQTRTFTMRYTHNVEIVL